MAKFRRALYPESWIGGVCSGLAYAIGCPVWLVRLAFVLLVLVFGVGILPYVLLWILAPTWQTIPEDFATRTGD